MTVPTRKTTAPPSIDGKPKSASQSGKKDLFDSFYPLNGKRLEILDPTGKVISPEWMPPLSDQDLISGYKTMLLARIADLKAVSYQRQGRLYTLPPNKGQEAAAVGSAMALEKGDWLVPAFRELGALLWRGVPVKTVFLFHGGTEYGNVYPEGVNVLPTTVPISSQLPHAAGIGHAINYRGGKEVVITYFGDGGTSEGDFSEALNWSAVFKCPVIFFCNNNQWAISVPRTHQTKARTLAQKAIGFEIPGIQVDGNDLLAVYRATKEAADWARSGKGPVLIEAETYRMAAHTTSDDPTKYRTSEEEALWAPRDPLIRMKAFLTQRGLWSDKQEEEYTEHVTTEVEAAFREAEQFPPNDADEIFEYAYQQLPDTLSEQKEDYKRFLAWTEARKQAGKEGK
jgi:pyruvate dehydrogenase E1 component alpha subunit